MERVINPATDFTNLRRAVCELFKEELFAAEDGRLVKRSEQAANAEAMLRSLPIRRTLSPGFYVRANYLLDLDLLFELGIRFELEDLTPEELRGLRAVRMGKTDFKAAHPECDKCSTPQKDKFAPRCERCGVEFQKRKAS